MVLFVVTDCVVSRNNMIVGVISFQILLFNTCSVQFSSVIRAEDSGSDIPWMTE